MTTPSFVRNALALVCVMWGSMAPAAEPQPSSPVIEEGRYATPQEAQAAWKPMAGSPGATLGTAEGQPGIRFSCPFANGTLERASWDRSVRLDLGACRGIQFKIFCRDASPVSYFSVYLQSGGGWYHGTFYPESTNSWNTVTLDKAATTVEGRPAGWSSISTVRVSAWKGAPQDTEFFIRDIRMTGLLGADAQVAVIRAESAGRESAGEARSVEQYAGEMGGHFEALKIGCAVLSDLDLTAARLRAAKLVVLPYNPSMPPAAVACLQEYVKGGGKLLAFYTIPEPLRAAVRVAEGRHVRPDHPGQFSAIRPVKGALPGAPETAAQQSWNINAFKPAPGGAVLAEWMDELGRPAGHAAVLGCSNGLVMSHVIIREDLPAKRRLLMAMAGYLVPDLWRQAAQLALDGAGDLGGFGGFDGAMAEATRLGNRRAKVSEAVAMAQKARKAADKLIAQGRFIDAGGAGGGGVAAGARGVLPGAALDAGGISRVLVPQRFWSWTASTGPRRRGGSRRPGSPRCCPTCSGPERPITRARPCPEPSGQRRAGTRLRSVWRPAANTASRRTFGR